MSLSVLKSQCCSVRIRRYFYVMRCINLRFTYLLRNRSVWSDRCVVYNGVLCIQNYIHVKDGELIFFVGGIACITGNMSAYNDQSNGASLRIQEIWANAHETRHSISIISYAGCLGLSPANSAKIHSLSVPSSSSWREDSWGPLRRLSMMTVILCLLPLPSDTQWW